MRPNLKRMGWHFRTIIEYDNWQQYYVDQWMYHETCVEILLHYIIMGVYVINKFFPAVDSRRVRYDILNRFMSKCYIWFYWSKLWKKEVHGIVRNIMWIYENVLYLCFETIVKHLECECIAKLEIHCSKKFDMFRNTHSMKL